MAILDKGIRILVIEDNPGDYLLIEEYLQEEVESPEIVHAKTLGAVEEIIPEEQPFDAILLDLSLPDASGESLVQQLVALTEPAPVIVLTGYENRDFGLKTLSMGISDYLLKDELDPYLLSKSISYSIERNRINRSLRESEKQYRDLFNLSPLPKWIFDLESLKFLDVNRAAIDHYGYSREEFLSMSITDIRPENEIKDLLEAKEQYQNAEGPHQVGLFTHRKKNGELILVEIQSSKIDYYGKEAKMVIAHDVTEQKENEAELFSLNEKLNTAQQIAKLGYWQFNIETGELYWSDEVYRIWERDPDTFQPTIESFLESIHPEDRDSFMQQNERAVEGKKDLNLSHRILLPDGSLKWVQERGTLQKKAEGEEPKIFEGTVQDISEKVEYEQKLKESLERYEYVTKATDELIYDWDITGNELKWDDSFYERFTEKPHSEIYTIEDWEHNVHPEDRDSSVANLNQTLSDPSKNKWEAEYRFQKTDGRYATVFERGFILRNDEGEAVRMIGSLQDITERKEYEEKLRELSLVAAKTTDVIIITDAEDRITWVNKAFEELTGYNSEEVLGQNPGKLLQGPETDPQTVNRIARAIDNRESIQEIILNYDKNGNTYWLDLTIDPILDEEGNCEAFIAIEKDVTEQIERQKKLRESVDRYETVSKATSDTIWDLDLVNDRTLYNENITNVFGYKKQQVNEPWQWWKEKIHPEDRPQVIHKIEVALATKQKRVQFEYRFQAADGSYKNVYDRAFIVTDEEDKPIRIIGAMQDVTKQKEEEQWLRLFESAIATTTESVIILEAEPSDKAGRKIIYVNEAFTEMTGYEPKEAIGETLYLLTGPKTNSDKISHLEQAMQQWQQSETELITYKKSEDEFWIHVSMAPVQDSDGNYSHWVCIGRDVTERIEREVKLRESLREKETLLLEIHHRVKNNLAVVSGMMQLQAFEEEDEKLQEKLYDSISRIKTMGSIHELLYRSESFSKLNLNENIEKLVNEITDTYGTNFDLDVNFDLEEINLNINQAIPFSLVINEVVTNALKHGFNGQKEGTLGITLKEKEELIHIEITDNGRGLPNDFSVADNKHKSLGLQLIDTLSKQLNAEYSYENRESKTCFSFRFQKSDVKGASNALLN